MLYPRVLVICFCCSKVIAVQLKKNASVGRFVKGFFKVEHDACSSLLLVEAFGYMLVKPEDVVLAAVFPSETGLAVW